MCTKLSIKALGKMMMMNKLRIRNINACGLKGWPIDARQAPYALERAKLARMERYQKCAFFEGGVGGHGCKLGVVGEFKWWPKGGPWLEDEALWCLAQEGEGVCVCVYEDLYPSSFHESFEEIHSQRVTIASFYSQKPLFIQRRWVLCM